MSSKRKIGCITSELYDVSKSETWNQIPVNLILLEPCPNCGGIPEVNVRRRKRGGDLYWVDCKACEYTGPAAKSERAARNWWNRNLNGRMDDGTWRRIDCIPTKILEHLFKMAETVATSDNENYGYGYSYNWISAELSIVLNARARIPELEKELVNLKGGISNWLRQSEIASSLATLRKTATHVTPGVYDWMMHIICEKFMEGE